ncbi:hypothetical protein [Arthrobacter sp. GMC3]|uniref:hypothetical protein n=1 Tax=Arthrobacter sp. GMC3 TaxID=2058894 RepID=UPI000CE41B2A|nr:hypothetical protein [Arthrobacter sp. GMC3]
MNTRAVNINYPDGPDPRAIAWFEANDIDPHTVVGEQEVLVNYDGRVMGYAEFILSDDGQRIPGGHGHLKQIKIVPMISTPENFGL